MAIEVINAPNAPKAAGPYSQAIRAGDFIFCAGQGGFEPDTFKLVEGGLAGGQPGCDRGDRPGAVTSFRTT